MQIIWKSILLAVLAVLPLAALSTREADPPAEDAPARFPEVTGDNLNGKTFRLPGDLEGELNVVVLGFAIEHQKLIDTWLPTLAKTAKVDPAFRYYEIPVTSRLPQIARSYIDNGMRSGIPDTRVRAITITLYIDKVPFFKSLRLPDEKTIYVLLVARQGTIHWRGEGAFTAAKGESLAKAMASVPGKAR